MKAIATVLDGITSTKQNIQLSITKSLSRSIFDKGIAWLEAAKQENFPPETLEVWYVEMNRLGWTDQIFREKMIATMRATTYGKIKFDDFTGSQTLYTEQEVAEIIERKINTRKAQYLWAKNQTVNEEELVSQGLGEVSAWWNSMMRRKLDEIKDKLDERCKELRVKFYTLPQSKKDTLLFIAIDKGLIVKDQYSMEVLPFLIPEMMQSFEKVIEG